MRRAYTVSAVHGFRRIAVLLGLATCLLVAVTWPANASRSGTPAPTGLLLTPAEVPAGFTVESRVHTVSAAKEAADTGMSLARFGRVSGAEVSYKNPHSLGLVDIDISVDVFRTAGGAHAAYNALVEREVPGSGSSFQFKAGNEAFGFNLTLLGISERTADWRYGRILIDLLGSYETAGADSSPFFTAIRRQQARLVRLAPQ